MKRQKFELFHSPQWVIEVAGKETHGQNVPRSLGVEEEQHLDPSEWLSPWVPGWDSQLPLQGWDHVRGHRVPQTPVNVGQGQSHVWWYKHIQ